MSDTFNIRRESYPPLDLSLSLSLSLSLYLSIYLSISISHSISLYLYIYLQVKALISRAESELGPVDILVNCAGLMYYTMMKNLHEDEWERQIDVNCKVESRSLIVFLLFFFESFYALYLNDFLCFVVVLAFINSI